MKRTIDSKNWLIPPLWDTLTGEYLVRGVHEARQGTPCPSDDLHGTLSRCGRRWPSRHLAAYALTEGVKIRIVSSGQVSLLVDAGRPVCLSQELSRSHTLARPAQAANVPLVRELAKKERTQ